MLACLLLDDTNTTLAIQRAGLCVSVHVRVRPDS